MKNLIFGSLFLAIVGSLLISCKKEDVKISGSKQVQELGNSDRNSPYYSDGKMLIFANLDEYNKIVNDPSDIDRETFLANIASMNHITYAEELENTNDDDLIANDFFNQVLNSDWIVQIGQFIYRVNPETHFVYVLPVSRASDYADLVEENMANRNIRQFSTEDDVIELAESGDEGIRAGCSENQASNPDWKSITYSAYEPYTEPVANSNHQYVRRYKRECKMNYLKLGIYFNLQAKLEVIGIVTISASSTGTYGQTSYFTTLNCITNIRSKRIYKIRCQPETGWYSVLSILTNGSNINKTEYNSYQGSKGITKYWLKCGFYYKTNANNANDISVYPDFLVGESLYQREIKSGY